VAEGVGEGEVVLADVFVIGAEVVAEAFFSDAVDGVTGGGGGDLDVHVVGRAAEHAVRVLGDDLERVPPAKQVVMGLWDQVGEGDGVAG
jgi:hypothetical protein